MAYLLCLTPHFLVVKLLLVDKNIDYIYCFSIKLFLKSVHDIYQEQIKKAILKNILLLFKVQNFEVKNQHFVLLILMISALLSSQQRRLELVLISNYFALQ